MSYRSPTLFEASLFIGGCFLATITGGLVLGHVGAVAGGLYIVATGWLYATDQMQLDEVTTNA